MPFLLVTGPPCSGKSTLVSRIVDHFKDRGKTVHVISDNNNATFSRGIYNDAQKEKDHRSFIRSMVQKSLNKNDIVICDGMNYIKGYRYELFLQVKLTKTTYGVLYCNSTEATCLWLNQQATEGEKYEGNLVQQLYQRYEKPDSRNRWDSPLFEVKVGTSERSLEDEIPDDMSYDLSYPSPKFVTIPLEDIYSWLCEGVSLTENQSTQVAPLAPTNFLHELDRVTQEVVSSIIHGQRDAVVGQIIVIPAAEAGSNQITVSKIRSLAELSRLRRQFISFSKTHPVDNPAKIASLFVNYLNTTHC